MASDLTDALFHSRTRSALLRLLFAEKVTDSVSGLARRAKLSQHAVAVEVKNLEKVGLVKVESEGAADRVRGNAEHPAAEPLLELLDTARSEASKPRAHQDVEESLTYYGAPLLGRKPHKHFTLEETLLRALGAAKRNPTLLKVLPVVLAKNERAVDWNAIKEGARRKRLKAELGMLVDLTADLANRHWLSDRVKDLRDRRRKVTSLFHEPRSKHERKLAEAVTPAAARKWNFLMNLSEETFRSLLRKHVA